MSTRTRVAVVGAGPAGLTTANVLANHGIDCVVLESGTRGFVENRARAGFVEEWAVRSLQRHGLADRLLRTAETQSVAEFRFDGRRHAFRYGELTGQRHFVYPQQLLVSDLVRRYVDELGGDARFGVRDVALHDVTGHPAVTFTGADGAQQRVDCDFVAGCDGARGVTPGWMGEDTSVARHDYGIGWMALLVEAPPSADGVLFGIHPRGFAAHMARSATVTRFYLQVPPGDDPGNWSHERIWSELHARLGVPGGELVEGPVVDQQVLDMHNYVTEPMSHGRLFLAGESAHLVAPIAAKGMNLALHDAFLLAEAFRAHYAGDESTLDSYTDDCLARVWQYQEFSQWLSEVFHSSSAPGDPFRARTAQARARRLVGSDDLARAAAELYTGVRGVF